MNNKKNPYEEYLPENRVKKEQGILTNTMKKISKICLYSFWAMVIILFITFGLWMNGSILQVDKRIYNLNIGETINLDSIYRIDKSKAEWVSNNNNIILNNNVVTASKSGEAYLYVKKDNKVMYDININILSGNEKLSIDNHTLVAKVGEKKSFTITKNANNNEINEPETIKERIINYIEELKKYFEKFLYTNSNENETISNHQNDSQIIGNESSNNTVTDEQHNNESNEQVNNTKEDEDDLSWIDNLTYTSSDESIATVDEDGIIETISPGTVVISVEDEFGNEDHSVITVENDEFIIYNTEYNLEKGEELQIEYSLISNTYSAEDIMWNSEDINIISIDENGKITAVGIGTTQVVINVGNIAKIVTVNVKEDTINPTNIELSTKKIILNVNNEEFVTAKVLPENAIDTSITWTSNDTNIAVVEDGIIVAKSPGTTDVCVMTSNGIMEKIEVTVNKEQISESIEVISKEIEINIGDTKKLEYVTQTDGKINIEYDKNYLTIDNDNNIIPIKSGKTNIILTTEKKSTFIKVTIIDPSIELKSIKFNPSSITLDEGEIKKINIEYEPVNATDKNITWKSSNTNIATIDANGSVTAISKGTTKITAISRVNESINATVSVTVNAKKEVEKTINVTFDCNGGNGGGKESFTTNVTNQKFTKTCTRKDYIQTGWNTKKDGTGNGYTISNVISGDWISKNQPSLTLYAIWKKQEIIATAIKLNKDKIELEIGEIEIVNANISPDNVTNKDISWVSSNQNVATIDVNGNIKAISAGTTTITAISKSNTKVKATAVITVKKPVQQPKKITVSFNCNGGTGGGTQIFTEGVSNQIFSKTCTRSGYILLSWNKKIDGSGNSYIINSDVSNNWIVSNFPSITLYAIWKNDGLPTDSKYYPLDGKKDGKSLKFLEIDGKYLTDSEIDNINKFLKDSVDSTNDPGTKVALAGWALIYSLSEKGLKLHYMRGGTPNGGYASNVINRSSTCNGKKGFCKNWGKVLNSSVIPKICNSSNKARVINSPGDCGSGKSKFYSGLQCDGFVKWALTYACQRGGWGNSGAAINIQKYRKGKDFSSLEPGDLLGSTGHIMIFLKKTGDKYLVAEANSGRAGGASVFHKHSESDLKKYFTVYKMKDAYQKYCK